MQESHHAAERLREGGHFLAALKLYEEVIIGYEKEKNYQRIADAVQGKFLTYKHLFWDSKDRIYAHLARACAKACMDIAKEYDLPMAFYYFSLGESHMLFNEYKEAKDAYRLSLDAYGDGPHIGNIRYHLGEARYRVGETEEGLQDILQGKREIEDKAGELGSFMKHVWPSGVHLRLADLLRDNNPQESRSQLAQARQIIEKDSRLTLRKRQLETLSRALKAE
jgi:TolA-binding protein